MPSDLRRGRLGQGGMLAEQPPLVRDVKQGPVKECG